MTKDNDHNSVRSHTVAVRVRRSELQQLREIAERDGRTVSNTIRQLVREAIAQREPISGRELRV